MKCSPAELNQMDFGVHMALYHEWNEEAEGTWHEATVLYDSPISIVLQPYTPSHGATTGESPFVAIASYRTGGEGDLLELYFADGRGVGFNYYRHDTRCPACHSDLR